MLVCKRETPTCCSKVSLHIFVQWPWHLVLQSGHNSGHRKEPEWISLLQSDLKCFCNNKHIGTQMLYCHLFFESERCLIAMFITTGILDWCLFLHHFVLATVHVKIFISFSHCLCVGECACTNRVNELDLSDNVVGQCLLCHCHWLLFGIPCVSHLKGVTFTLKFLV